MIINNEKRAWNRFSFINFSIKESTQELMKIFDCIRDSTSVDFEQIGAHTCCRFNQDFSNVKIKVFFAYKMKVKQMKLKKNKSSSSLSSSSVTQKSDFQLHVSSIYYGLMKFIGIKLFQVLNDKSIGSTWSYIVALCQWIRSYNEKKRSKRTTNKSSRTEKYLISCGNQCITFYFCIKQHMSKHLNDWYIHIV